MSSLDGDDGIVPHFISLNKNGIYFVTQIKKTI